MKFYIETFGCKVNSYESNYVKQSLIESGFVFEEDIAKADIVIINTCTVTNTADSKCKKFVRRIKREYNKAILVVMGCSVQNNFEEYSKLGIDILLGNINKSRIKDYINNYLQNKEPMAYYEQNRNLPFEDMIINNFDHTRAYIKIQDGCDNFCTYCIIPFMRGKCRSKEFNKIIKEANDLVLNGHLEIVLTGIHTGSYNYESHDLVDVINELSKIEKLERIRLSSVEITELNAKFMTMLKTNPKFCDHLHIPLQSGSDEVLKKMNRKYDIAYFMNKIAEIRKIRPNISITTDVIVGFPEENEKTFLETYENIQKINFSKLHVFPYSKRNGTKAALLKEVPSIEKTNWTHKLLALSKQLENAYEEKFIGKPVDVLIEEIKDGKSIGHTPNYLRVEIPKVLEKGKIYTFNYKS